MKLKYSLIIIFLSLFFSISKAQHRAVGPYNTGIGLRAGFLYGLTLKHFLNTHVALEGLGGTRWQGYTIIGLFEYQSETHFSEDIDWFVGFGGHAGNYERKYFLENGGALHYTGNVYAVGIDAIVGLEYKVNHVPLTIGIDFKPFFDLVNSNHNYLDAGLTARFVFK